MDIPVKISQNWRTKDWNPTTRKWELYPVVSAKQTQFDRMKPVARKVWFDYIRKGWMTVTDDMRKWLDENGFSDVKPASLPDA